MARPRTCRTLALRRLSGVVRVDRGVTTARTALPSVTPSPPLLIKNKKERVGKPLTKSADYTCGLEGTADPLRTKDGAHKLRNMHDDMATTHVNTCSRHWCYDTTAMYVCNWTEEDLVIPYYNIGWMTDGLDRLCCDDDYGKSGQMWHYSQNYTVVLGYGDCNFDETESQPYPMGSGNNGMCNAWDTTIWEEEDQVN
jgi:hypothetical protein